MQPTIGDRLIGKFELVMIALLQLLLVVVVTIATLQLFVLLFKRVPSGWSEMASTDDLHAVLQHAFGGVLVVVLGLELIETLKVYFREHKVRLEVIMIVSMIAVGRHVIQADYAHLEGLQLIGMGALITALAGGYYFIAKAHAKESRSP